MRDTSATVRYDGVHAPPNQVRDGDELFADSWRETKTTRDIFATPDVYLHDDIVVNNSEQVTLRKNLRRVHTNDVSAGDGLP